jgi:hypothetical protein
MSAKVIPLRNQVKAVPDTMNLTMIVRRYGKGARVKFTGKRSDFVFVVWEEAPGDAFTLQAPGGARVRVNGDEPMELV